MDGCLHCDACDGYKKGLYLMQKPLQVSLIDFAIPQTRMVPNRSDSFIVRHSLPPRARATFYSVLSLLVLLRKIIEAERL
jgi:hypothetical protein